MASSSPIDGCVSSWQATTMTADTCVCGHLVSDHTLPITDTGRVAPPQAHACSVCYCGRDVLAGATATTCDWCTTQDRIVWAVTAASKAKGKNVRMPIQPEPDATGNVEIQWTGQGVPIAVVHGSPPGMFDDWTPYRPHHADCDMKLRKQPEG